MIKEISYTRFRGHEGAFTFGPGRNLIKGPNESGKSTIKEAIAFTWMGTDSAGTKNPDHLITVGQETAEVRLTTPKSKIARRKKRGATSEIKIIRDGIPDVKLSQTDIMNQLGISFEVFMSSWSVGYFMNLRSEAKLKVLGEIAKIDRKVLLSTIVDTTDIPTQVKFINPKIDADVVAGLRRTEQNKRQATEAAQAVVLQQLHNMPTEILDIDPAAHQALVAELDAKLQEHAIYKQQLPKWKAENEKRANAAGELTSLREAVSTSESECKKYEKQLAKLKNDKELSSQKIKETSTKIKELRSSHKAVEMPMPTKPSLKSGSCPTCGTDIPETKVSSLVESYKKEVDKYNEHSRKVADFNQKLSQTVLELEKALDAEESILNKIVRNAAECEASVNMLTQKVSKLRTAIEQTQRIPSEALPPPQAPDGDENAIMAQRDNAKEQLHAYNLFNTQRNRLQSDLKSNAAAVDKFSAEIKRLAELENALLRIPEIETSATLEKIAVEGIKMSLNDGELVVTDSEGVDYRCLSDGRRMKIDVALCLAIKKAETRCPDWLFVDNADLMDEEVYVPDGIQVFIAQVDPSSKEVKVISL